MKKLLFVVLMLFASAAFAVPPHVCAGPAALHNPHCTGGGGGGGGGGDTASNSSSDAGSSHMAKFVKIAIVAVAAYVIVCTVLDQRDPDSKFVKKYCGERKIDQNVYEYGLAKGSTNVYARRWI